MWRGIDALAYFRKLLVNLEFLCKVQDRFFAQNGRSWAKLDQGLFGVLTDRSKWAVRAVGQIFAVRCSLDLGLGSLAAPLFYKSGGGIINGHPKQFDRYIPVFTEIIRVELGDRSNFEWTISKYCGPNNFPFKRPPSFCSKLSSAIFLKTYGPLWPLASRLDQYIGGLTEERFKLTVGY